MQGGGGRVDVLVVLAAGLLEPVQPTVAIVLGQAGIRLPVLRQLHCGVLAVHHSDHLNIRSYSSEKRIVEVLC